MEIETKFTTKDPNDFSTHSNFASQEPESNMSAEVILKDLAAGSVAGVANVLSGHPFDTVKVRMQLLNTKLTTCVKSLVAKEGVTSFYKGVYSPLYSVPMVNAVVFGAYESARRFMMSKDPEAEMTMTQGMLAGSWAGLLNCIVVTPVELIKCRQQIEGMGSKVKVTKSMDIAKYIVKNEGFSGLYRGNLITIMREMPAYAAQFGSYEIFKSFLTKKYGESKALNFVAGAGAGFMCWVFSYPQDIIKTKIQCDFAEAKRRYISHPLFRDGGIITCAKDIFRKEGLRGFWRGFSACTMRAMIANAFTFVAYEEAKQIFI